MAHQKTFYLKDGKVFSTLEKFSKELQTMTQDVFKHHVNKDKHDFKEWMKHSLKEEELAKKVEKKINKLELELEVLRHLVHQKSNKKVTSTKKSEPKKVESKTKSATKKVTPAKKSKTSKTTKAKK